MKRALLLPMMTTLLFAGEGMAAPGGGEVDRLAAEYAAARARLGLGAAASSWAAG